MQDRCVGNKFKPKFEGSFTVEVVNRNALTYQVRRGNSIIRAHHTHLLPWRDPPAYLQTSDVCDHVPYAGSEQTVGADRSAQSKDASNMSGVTGLYFESLQDTDFSGFLTDDEFSNSTTDVRLKQTDCSFVGTNRFDLDISVGEWQQGKCSSLGLDVDRLDASMNSAQLVDHGGCVVLLTQGWVVQCVIERLVEYL